MTFNIETFLQTLVSEDAPDLILVSGEPAAMRCRTGDVLPLSDAPVVHPADIEQVLTSLAGKDALAQFLADKEYEIGFERPGLGRFRATFYIHDAGPALIVRLIPFEIPTPDDIDIPVAIQDMALRPDGLILVTGPNGHGKSTTLASLVNHINAHRHAHIVTIEDPIEFVYQRKKSVFSQRAVGQHTVSFPTAIRHTLRQSVDVIVIGEMRDLETISTALTLAETGHLVLATLHTHDAPRTCQRIIDVFPAAQQQQVAVQFSHALTAIMSQRLIPRADGTGRACAREILINNSATAHAIRERKISELYTQIQINREMGMISFDDSLLGLVADGSISAENALYEAHDQKHLVDQLRGRGLA